MTIADPLLYHLRRVQGRSVSTIKPLCVTAGELPPKSIELEQRIAHLEMEVQALRQALQEQTRRNVSLQARFDHLAARLSLL